MQPPEKPVIGAIPSLADSTSPVALDLGPQDSAGGPDGRPQLRGETPLICKQKSTQRDHSSEKHVYSSREDNVTGCNSGQHSWGHSSHSVCVPAPSAHFPYVHPQMPTCSIPTPRINILPGRAPGAGAFTWGLFRGRFSPGSRWNFQGSCWPLPWTHAHTPPSRAAQTSALPAQFPETPRFP